MPIIHIKIDRAQQTPSPLKSAVTLPDDEILEYEAMIAADLGIICGPLLNNQANPK